MSDMSELFARDPLKLEKAAFETILTEMRRNRANFNLGNMKAGSTKPPSAKTKESLDLTKKLGLELDL